MSIVEIIILSLSLIDAICCLVCRIPQIVRLIRLKESRAISIPFWACNIFSCICCIIAYALKIIVLNEMTTIVFLFSASCNFILNSLTLFLVLKYRQKAKVTV